MTYKKINIDIKNAFDSLLDFENEDKEIKHEATMIMFRFLSELEKLNYKDSLKKKEIAQKLGTSPSYITQLFRGDKLVNLLTLAKMQKAYDFEFEIKAKPNKVSYAEEVEKMQLRFIKNIDLRPTWSYSLAMEASNSYENEASQSKYTESTNSKFLEIA